MTHSDWIWIAGIVAYLAIGMAFTTSMKREMERNEEYGREIRQAARDGSSGTPLKSTTMLRIFFITATALWPIVFLVPLISSIWHDVTHRGAN